MAIFGAIVLVVVLLVRPMEIVPAVAKLHLLEVLTGVTAIGVAAEAVARRSRLGTPPQLPWLLAFLGWAFFVTVARIGSEGFAVTWAVTALAAIFMLVVAFAALSRARLYALVAVLGGTLALIAAIAVHQGHQPKQCIELVGSPDEGEPTRLPDGRDCDGRLSCEQNGNPDAEYLCERIGALGTISTGGRVRYRGQLDDPNEISVFLGAGLPLVALLGGKRWRTSKLLIVTPIVAVSLWAIVLSQSRTGQMVVGSIALIALVRRFGPKGVAFALAASPLFLLVGGREGADAEASTLERATILYEGIDLVRAHPVLGVGIAQFSREISIPMTAHNSYLLAGAELGIIGLVLWSGMLWTSLKVAIVVATAPPPGIDPELVRFAEALAMSLAAMFVGIFFLSFAFKQLLFVWLGLAAGLHGAVQARAPTFRVRTTARDVAGLFVFAILILIAIFVISRGKAT